MVGHPTNLRTWTHDDGGPQRAPSAVGLGLLLVRRYVLRWLERLAERTGSPLDNLTIGSLTVPAPLWCVAIDEASGLEVPPNVKAEGGLGKP